MMKDFNDYATKKEEETGVAINIDTYNASASQSTQNSQVENMITEGCDVICVNLVDRTDPTAIIDLAEKTIFRLFFQSRTGGGRFRALDEALLCRSAGI